ncbi:MAG: hypothetical protein ACNA74_02505 [Desulfurivibrio sp.]
MTVAGVSIILLLGITLFFTLIFQLLTGLRVIRVTFSTHRKVGFLLVVLAMIHGSLAILANM